MARQSLFVTWTIDCETVQQESPVSGGPESWVLAERSMCGYVEALAARGHRCTLFLIPRLAEGVPRVVRELGAAGADLGLHLHPQTTDLGYDRHLGQLPVEAQRTLLAQGRDRVAAVTGQAPTSFRPGCFSATWETFPLLAELGFTQGSVTLPGRHLPAVGAAWANDPPFAHWREAGAGRRFLEMPTTATLEEIGPHREPPCDPTHLRLERSGILDWGPALIREHVRRQVEHDWWLKSVVVMTHDTRRYDDPKDPYRRNLEGIADAIEAVAAEFDLEMAPATLAQVQGAVGANCLSGPRDEGPETRDQGPRTTDHGLGTRDQGPGTNAMTSRADVHPRICHPEPPRRRIPGWSPGAVRARSGDPSRRKLLGTHYLAGHGRDALCCRPRGTGRRARVIGGALPGTRLLGHSDGLRAACRNAGARRDPGVQSVFFPRYLGPGRVDCSG